MKVQGAFLGSGKRKGDDMTGVLGTAAGVAGNFAGAGGEQRRSEELMAAFGNGRNAEEAASEDSDQAMKQRVETLAA